MSGRKVSIVPWLWVAPAVLMLLVYLVYPVINTAYLSFLDRDSKIYVGGQNYQWIFGQVIRANEPPENARHLIGDFYYLPGDRETGKALRNNALWLIIFTTCTVGFGLVIAVLFDRVRYETLVKSFIFLPQAISFVAAGAIWKFMMDFNPNIGLVNAVLKNLLLRNPIAWLQREPVNNSVLIVVGIWMWTGFCMVILSAALKSIPKEIIEAARVDGANEWQIFWRVTVPMLSTTIIVVATTMIINVLKVFDIVYVMTSGRNGTDVIANRMYFLFYVDGQNGRSAAVAVILLLAIIPIMLFNVRRFRAEEAMR
ncbi:MAG: sugar ABC transporter permease [Chloroflexi bacterium]|nr:sugar ABC transporter permease [Chloroflexota bacterium]